MPVPPQELLVRFCLRVPTCASLSNLVGRAGPGVLWAGPRPQASTLCALSPSAPWPPPTPATQGCHRHRWPPASPPGGTGAGEGVVEEVVPGGRAPHSASAVLGLG